MVRDQSLDSSAGTSAAPERARRSVWVKRALVLAYATMGYNLVEGGVAIGFGVSDESVALLGFGLDSLIEVVSAALVLWRFRGEHGATALPARDRERRATLGIGILFGALATATFAAGVQRLWTQTPPEATVAGVVISSLSLSFMFFLYAAKRRAAQALDSATVRSDAACSLACIKLSIILLAGSLVYWLAPALWWADAAAALGLAVLIGREGWEMARAARHPDFSGGCGCS